MRVISGKYRGRKLDTIEGLSTRPTSDRVKVSLFNIIQFRIADSMVLDLFAGSGALGIECISRGAKYVTFCDSNRTATEMIYKNLRGFNDNYKIVNADYKRVLNSGGRYDIIFVDAPYKSGLGAEALAEIVNCKNLTADGIICYERKDNIPYTVPAGLVCYDSRKYGETALDFLRYE